jgi:lipoprotein signal peptidase
MRGGIAVTVNTGASFGTPFGLSAAFIPFMIIIVLAGLVAFLYRSISPLSLGLLVGAALSNVADRFWFGGVRDWLTVPLFGLRNNLADWILCLAIALAVVQSAQGIYGTKKREEKT